MANRLIDETSPYLLQHAHNPVDWYPWGEEALARAKREDQPIFLSIGYAACHWCHVMERESFEDPETAALMNANFVCIKVDREERPDLDGIYMDAVVALTGQGGWPMSVFLTPDGQPFYGGTYYPPAPRHGLPAFRQVLAGVADAWRTRRAEVKRSGASVVEHVQPVGQRSGPDTNGALDPATFAAAARSLWQAFDWTHAGWGGAPKFPQPMAIEFLLRHYLRAGDKLALEMAEKSLTAMARGGMYDQVGGGFHRYSTDAHWLVPHFEKMLYDNSQLARAYLHAWQMTGRSDYRRVTEEILDYVAREMADPAGGFYSTQDADSEGEEGKFFVWTPAEIRAVLGADAPLFEAAYGVTARGNFEGRNILFVAADAETLARKFNLSPEEIASRLKALRITLYALRDTRVHPGLDDKVLAAWNGLMLAAFAEAARVLKRADYLEIARRNAEFLLLEMRAADGRLFRSWRQGQARLNGYLEDYTHLVEGLLTLYETTFDARWFVAARELADHFIAHFRDEAGGFFDTRDDHETLVVRPKSMQDNAVPSGNAVAALVLLKLGAFTGEARYGDLAEEALRSMQPLMGRHPMAFGQWLCALDFALGARREIAIVGDPDAPDTRALLNVVFTQYRPDQVVALARPGETPPIPLLAGREQLDGRATASVCQNFACRLPVTDPAALAEQLAE